jgi:hypothetical protein
MALEEFSRNDLNNFLARGRRLNCEIDLDAIESSSELERFKRISKRKKLLTLIALTDKENETFVEAVEPFMSSEDGKVFSWLGSMAWNSINWAILVPKRTKDLLSSNFITPELSKRILEAEKRGGLADKDSTVLHNSASRTSCIYILQHGSLKQRIWIIEALPKNALRGLLITSPNDLLERAMNWSDLVA